MADERDVEAFVAAIRDLEARPVRFTDLEVLEWTMPADRKVASPIPQGTIVVFMAERGSPDLAALRAGATAGDDIPLELVARLGSKLRPAAYRAAAYTPERLLREAPSAAERLTAAPVVLDLRYGSSTLISHVMIEDPSELHIAILPYAGGRLAPAGFTMVEHYRKDAYVEIDAVVIRSVPPLTPAEEAALDELSGPETELNVGKGLLVSDDANAALVVAAVVITVVVVAAASEFLLFTAAVEATDAAAAAVFFGATVKAADDVAAGPPEEEGPAATVRKLLDIRREALRRPGR